MYANVLEREADLAELHRLLRQASHGKGCLILIGGEAGVGKTTLLRRFAEETGATTRVLIGQCDGLSTPRALGPLFDIAAADSHLRGLLGDEAPRDLVFRSLLTRLGSGTRPVLFGIEDAHWADEATLDALRYVGRRVEETRSLVIVTYRDDEIGPRHPFRRMLGHLASVPAVTRMTLRPLSPEGVATLAAGSGVDAKTLYDRTHGNPFFVTAVLAAGGEIPATVRDAVLARVSDLPADAWALLEAAAVLGSPIDFALLGAVAGAAIIHLDACIERGVLASLGQDLFFRHELAREAILSAVPFARRAALHASILEILEATPHARHDVALLAHHAEGAGDAAAVLRHAPEAARRAAILGAHREAAEHYGHVLRFAEALPPTGRAGYLEALAHECYLTARIDRAMTARIEALAIWHNLRNPLKAGENRCHLAGLYWAQARIGDAEREAEAAVAILERLPPGPELATAYGTLARLRGTTLNDDESISLGEQAIALAERVGTPSTVIDALMTVGEARLVRGLIEPGQRQVERSMRLSIAAGLDALTARAYVSLGYGFAESGRLRDGVRHFERGIRYCIERDLDLPQHHLTALLARCQLALGNWDEARLLSATVLAAREVAPASRFVALVVAALIAVRRGEPGAEPLLAEAFAMALDSGCIQYLGPVHAARAEARYLSGDPSAASREALAPGAFALERGHRRYAAELAYWVWKGGGPATPAASVEPFAVQMAGDWSRAAAAWDALACPYEAAWARAEGGDEAAVLSALATFESLQARPAAALARRRLRQIGAREIPRGPRPSTRAHPARLTPRETQVLGLLAKDCGNREIARQLFLSPRTVENHVASILTKLGATCRADAAAAASRFGLTPQSE